MWQRSIDIEALVTELSARIQVLPDRKTARVRALRREYSKRLAQETPRTVIELAARLLDQPGFVYRLVAYELVCHHRAALRGPGAVDLKRLGRGIDCWEAVDTFACYLAGPAWRERQVADA